MKNFATCFLIACIFLSFCVVPSSYTYSSLVGTNSSRLEVILDPTVPQSKNSCNGASVPTWAFKVTIKETGGVGVTIDGIGYTFYDDNFNPIGSKADRGAALDSIFAGCSKQIPAFGEVCANLCVDLNGRRSGHVALSISAFNTGDPGNGPPNLCSGTVKLLGSDGTQGADLSITHSKTTNLLNNFDGDATPGDFEVFTIKVINNGPEAATGVTVTDSVPPTGAVFNAVAVSQGTYVSRNGLVTCSLGIIPSGSFAMVWLVVKITGQPNAEVKNSASVTGTLIDPNPTDNMADAIAVIGTPRESSVKSDLSVISVASSESAAPGTQLTYNVTVRNAGPGPADAFTLFDILPVGVTFSSINVNSGGRPNEKQTPKVGASGAIIVTISSLPVGETITVAIKVNILTPDGSVLMNKAEILGAIVREKFPEVACGVPLQRPGANDTSEDNNTALDGKTVRGGGLVELSWELPAPSSSDSTPAPRNLRVSPASSVFSISEADIFGGGESLSKSFVRPQATCKLQGFNVYQSISPNVATVPTNLVKVVAAIQSLVAALYKTNVPVAPVGSYYAVTAVWKCTSDDIETSPGSGVGVLAGPALEEIVLASKLTIRGTGFSLPLEVFIDGIGFMKPARLKNEKVILQKGLLSNGKSMSELIGPGKTPLLTIRNSNGGISSTLLAQ